MCNIIIICINVYNIILLILIILLPLYVRQRGHRKEGSVLGADGV